jgi:hypothetical protein
MLLTNSSILRLIGTPLGITLLHLHLGPMLNAHSPLLSIIRTPLLTTRLDGGTVLLAHATLEGLVATSLGCAQFHLGTVFNAHAPILSDIATPLCRTVLGLDLGTVLDANATRLGLVGTPLTTTQLDLGTVLFTHSSTLSLI